MWQLYIYDENGNEKPYLKPWNDIESAEKFAEMLDLKPYTVKNING